MHSGNRIPRRACPTKDAIMLDACLYDERPTNFILWYSECNPTHMDIVEFVVLER